MESRVLLWKRHARSHCRTIGTIHGFAERPAETSGIEFQNAGKGTPQATAVSGLVVKNDGNNVSLDREARLLAENALRFNLATNLMRSQISAVRSAIKEGQA
jgi:flagellar basal-body rod protein FlgB